MAQILDDGSFQLQMVAPGRYRVRIGRGREYLGSYLTAEEAARRYDQVALERLGPDAVLNFPQKDKAK